MNTKSILKRWDMEWWQELDMSWKYILLSNYCFNYDEFTKLTMQDCHIESPAMGSSQSPEEYLMLYSLWVGGDLVGGTKSSFEKYLTDISLEILEFIIYKTRFLYCSGCRVTSLKPLLNLTTVTEISDIRIPLNYTSNLTIINSFNTIEFDETNGSLNLKKI